MSNLGYPLATLAVRSLVLSALALVISVTGCNRSDARRTPEDDDAGTGFSAPTNDEQDASQDELPDAEPDASQDELPDAEPSSAQTHDDGGSTSQDDAGRVTGENDAMVDHVAALQTFCDALAAKALTVKADCYPLQYPENNRAAALSAFTAHCMTAARLLEPGVLEFDAVAAAACVAKPPVDRCEVPNCHVFVGQLPSGAACRSTAAASTGKNEQRIDFLTGRASASRCSEGSICAMAGVSVDIYQGRVGVCTSGTYDIPTGDVGERCTPPLSVCKAGLYCVLDAEQPSSQVTRGVCAEGSAPVGTACSSSMGCWGRSYCVDGRCRGPGRPGEPCVSGDCEEGSYCAPQADAGASGACVAVKLNDAPCVSSVECGSRSCDALTSRCVAPASSELPGAMPCAKRCTVTP